MKFAKGKKNIRPTTKTPNLSIAMQTSHRSSPRLE